MKIILTGTLLSILRTVSATTCVEAPFRLELENGCSIETFMDAFKSLFEDPLSRKAGCTNTLPQDLAAYGVTEELVTKFCESATFPDPTTTFSDIVGAAGGDALFTKQYYDGGTNWNEEVETTEDGDTTNVLKEDAAVVGAYYGVLKHEALQWPNELSNFDLSTCELNVAMCCWVQDRQAKDGNGNCAKPYDTECVDKDPGDNTDLCFVHLDRGSESNHVKSNGISVFPEKNGEGPIHCHGHAWGNDVSDFTSRYKANNLFYVSMYDHMYTRGYVRNVPGAPMCGCVEQMPIVSRSDCTQTNVEEKYAVTCDESLNFSAELINVEIEFKSCQGKKNNNLWSYYETLYSEKKVTLEQKNKLYSHLVGVEKKKCPQALERNLAAKGIVKGISDSAYPYVITFPEVDTSEFVHGICVAGASSATAISTDADLVYKEVPNFKSGQTAWGNRENYPIIGVESTICNGGIFLQPNRHKKIDRYSEITVGANAIGESVEICAFVEASTRDGNWPETIVEDSRFEDYGAETGLAWVNNIKVIPFHLLCKKLPEMPTTSPTQMPTMSPTHMPTMSPTPNLSFAPSMSPARMLTMSPTHMPTMSPTPSFAPPTPTSSFAPPTPTSSFAPPTPKPSFAPGTRLQKIVYAFPPTETPRLVHGLCVTNLASVFVESSLLPQLTYEANPIVEDMKAWKDRNYINEGVKGGPCEGGTFLQPSFHKSIPMGTDIEVNLERLEENDAMTVCAFVSDIRDGNWPSLLVKDGFTNYQQTTGLHWTFNGTPHIYALLCKDM